MTGSQRGPAARRSNIPLRFLILAIVGLLIAVVAFELQVKVSYYYFSDIKYPGLLLFVIGIIGAIISAIVKAAQRSRAPQIQPPFGTATSAAPGWYPDPQYPNMMRYFDGRVWTSSTQPRSS
jgi:hypothetical protein